MTTINEKNNQNVGNAGEYFFAHVLSCHNFIATITLGRAEKVDILAVNPKGQTYKIQVKTLYGNGPMWRMNPKDENARDDVFYAFVRLSNLEKPPEYWLIPGNEVGNFVRKYYQKWEQIPGRYGQAHKKGAHRAFRVTTDKYTPQMWTEKCEDYKMNQGLKQLI